MRLQDLRHTIQTQHLSNDKISAREANAIVKALGKDGLTGVEEGQLQALREEFKDKFTAAGGKAFDKALLRAVKARGKAAPTPGLSAANARLAALSGIGSDFKLAEISDPAVRATLEGLDLNNDGRVNMKDAKIVGFSEDQLRVFAFAALLKGQRISSDVQVPTDLTGKRVCFTAVSDKAKATKWAEAMGAKVETRVKKDLDYVFVGDADKTGKDERAFAMNSLGRADITVARHGAFLMAATEAGVVESASARITDAQYSAKVTDTLRGFYESYINDGYDDALMGADSPSDADWLEGQRATELAAFDPWYEGSEMWDDDIDWQYENGQPYLDTDGAVVPRDDVSTVAFSFFPELDGIGLSKVFVFDRRTGNVLDEGDVMD